eukprot:1151391-Pelagomonas_calceolata.AAC.7
MFNAMQIQSGFVLEHFLDTIWLLLDLLEGVVLRRGERHWEVAAKYLHHLFGLSIELGRADTGRMVHLDSCLQSSNAEQLQSGLYWQ